MKLHRCDVPPLYALTRPTSPCEDVAQLVAAGVRWIQIRDKTSHDDRLYIDLVRARTMIPEGTRLFVNDRVDLALACAADGVHLGETDLDPRSARLVAGERQLLIGYSTHDVSEAIDAARRDEIDYVAIGPIFRSPTKNVREALGTAVLSRIRAGTDKPIIAIGGIDASNIESVLDAGADSAAVISALYASDDIVGNASALMLAAGLSR